jgi:hypothetical protein
LRGVGARYATGMTHDENEEIRDEQGLPDDGPGSKATPPSNPDAESGEEDKGKEKLDKIVNW